MAAIVAARGMLKEIKAPRVLAKVSPPRSIRWVRCIKKGCRLMGPAAHRPSLVQAGDDNTVNLNRDSPNGVIERFGFGFESGKAANFRLPLGGG